jgi:hypothetical protein
VAKGVRDEYAAHPDGARGWYRDRGATYRNPHEDAVVAMIERSLRTHPDAYAGAVLDLAAGSGEVSAVLIAAGVTVDACDPYTSVAYEQRLSRRCEPWSFEDVAAGALGARRFSGIVCSYALHLCEQSWLPVLCAQMRLHTDRLVVITPHKRPELQPAWGWRLVDEHRDLAWRVRLRHYRTAPTSRSFSTSAVE